MSTVCETVKRKGVTRFQVFIILVLRCDQRYFFPCVVFEVVLPLDQKQKHKEYRLEGPSLRPIFSATHRHSCAYLESITDLHDIIILIYGFFVQLVMVGVTA